ncbi:hypothetical protein GSY71_15880 [Pusillimonas sp. TS35]|uniref:hypothetical protein n=1 Tax=Paracandidimonas lactea TaxID=2895524 RepID=UPI00136B6105|nr:hypothetical protein [Paracandidimonas lactea]MYN14619.1 hypothetical protein [Pusillimonas sp. TS35]
MRPGFHFSAFRAAGPAPAWLGPALLLAAVAFDRLLTGAMWLHMLVHIPLILAAGVCLAAAARADSDGAGKPADERHTERTDDRYVGRADEHNTERVGERSRQVAEACTRRGVGDRLPGKGVHGRWRRHVGRFNAYGIPGLLFFSLVGAYWMIPRALDGAALAWPLAVAKYVSLLAAGYILHDSLRRANMVIQLFFLGNFCWMLAVVGMLYRDNPQRLCNVYLLGDQVIAGTGLLLLALGLPLAWAWAWRRRIAGFLR